VTPQAAGAALGAIGPDAKAAIPALKTALAEGQFWAESALKNIDP
jgi:hypothetical protein